MIMKMTAKSIIESIPPATKQCIDAGPGHQQTDEDDTECHRRSERLGEEKVKGKHTAHGEFLTSDCQNPRRSITR